MLMRINLEAMARKLVVSRVKVVQALDPAYKADLEREFAAMCELASAMGFEGVWEALVRMIQVNDPIPHRLDQPARFRKWMDAMLPDAVRSLRILATSRVYEL